MLSPLEWTIWGLAASHLMTGTSARRVSWEDLMIATSKFPRFFGSPAIIPRSDPPKVTGLAFQNGDYKKPLFKTGRVEPMDCSSDSGSLSCAYRDCTGDKCGEPSNHTLLAVAALQEGQSSSLSHLLDGLDFAYEYRVSSEGYKGTLYQTFFFTQTLGGLIPIDNSVVELNLNEYADGSYYLPIGKDRAVVYTGEFDHGPTDTGSLCNKFHARDTASQAALNQPFWYAVNLPERMEATTVYTVQDGSLYLTWRLKFNIAEEVGDDFFVWVNARNCSQVVAAAPAKMDPWLGSLEDFQKEQKRLFKGERGIDLQGSLLA